MNTEDITQLIEMYLDGNLKKEEINHFNSRAKEDHNLINEVKLQSAIRETFQNRKIHEFRDLITERSRPISLNLKFKIKTPLIVYSLIIILVIASLKTYFVFKTDFSNDTIYVKYYNKYQISRGNRGFVENEGSLYSLGLIRFEQNDYNNAINILSQIPVDSSNYLDSEFYIGLSYMEIKDYKSALLHFNEFLKDQNNIYYFDVVWYSGLCLLAINQNEKAKKQFRILLQEINQYNIKARSILMEIETNQ